MKNVNFHSCVAFKNKVWFLSIEGYLMNFDCITLETQIICPVNLSELQFKQVIDNMVVLKNRIYFVEQDGSRLYEYDMERNFCSYYMMSNVKSVNGRCFSGVYLYNNMIYLFAVISGTVYCFNTDTKGFTQVVMEMKSISMHSIKVGDKVYLYGEKFIYFDMRENQFRYLKYQDTNYIYWIQQLNNRFYILTKNQICIWDESIDKYTILYEFDEDIGKFGVFFFTRSKIFLFSEQSSDIWVIDRRSGIISYEIPPKDLVYGEKVWTKYWGYTQDDRNIWLANRNSNYTISIDHELEIIKWNKLIKPDKKEKLPYLHLINRQLFDETEFQIEDFLLINNNSVFKDKKSYGKIIWNSIT